MPVKYIQIFGIAVLLLSLFVPSVFAQSSWGEWATLNKEIQKLRGEGQYNRAVTAAEQALEAAEKSYGPDHPNTAISLNNLAEIYMILGEYAKAESLYNRSLAIHEKIFGPDHFNMVRHLKSIAKFYYDHAFYEKAELLYKRALTIQEKVLSPNHPDIATSINSPGPGISQARPVRTGRTALQTGAGNPGKDF